MTSPRHPLLARLDGGPLLCDGAMGTLLYERGVPYDRCFDALNPTDRERVLNVHPDHLRAGPQMSVTDGGRTRYGHGPAEVVAGLEQAGVDVIGANCSVGPVPMLEVIQRMASLTRRPLSAQPNAGFPALVDGRYLYLSSPTHLAAYARKMVEAGAVVIGRCCGTTPAHISAIGQAIAGLPPAPFRAVVPEAPG